MEARRLFFQKLSKKPAAGTTEHTLVEMPENRIDISASHIANDECLLVLAGGAIGARIRTSIIKLADTELQNQKGYVTLDAFYRDRSAGFCGEGSAVASMGLHSPASAKGIS